MRDPIYNFSKYLTERLIPDLKNSGRVEDAKDFQKVVKFLSGKKTVSGYDVEGFLGFLKMAEGDAINAGFYSTAEDFRTAHDLINWMNNEW